MQLLLEHGAEVDARDKVGEPLVSCSVPDTITSNGQPGCPLVQACCSAGPSSLLITLLPTRTQIRTGDGALVCASWFRAGARVLREGLNGYGIRLSKVCGARPDLKPARRQGFGGTWPVRHVKA